MAQVIKKIGFVVLLAVCSIAVNAQMVQGSTKLKKHHCTAACVNGKHMYKHGEKGHVCDASCKAAMSSTTMELKDHVCTAACTNGNHVYAHGEKGHVCDANCKKTK